jgi:hypothetical protein
VESRAGECPQPFTLSLSLVVRCGSYTQQIVGSCILIQSDDLCLLIGELSPFPFRVIIESCLLIPVFLLLFFQTESHIDCSLILVLFNFMFSFHFILTAF